MHEVERSFKGVIDENWIAGLPPSIAEAIRVRMSLIDRAFSRSATVFGSSLIDAR